MKVWLSRQNVVWPVVFNKKTNDTQYLNCQYQKELAGVETTIPKLYKTNKFS